MPKMEIRYAEDYVVGEVIDLGQYHLSKEEVVSFAEQWDPQPFHIDEDAAQRSIFGGLIASGWHVALIMMRMMWESGFISAETSQGSPGHDALKWLKPVRPGDTLSGKIEVVDVNLSRSRPGIGFVTAVSTLNNQHGEQVYWLKSASIVKSRSGSNP